MSLLDKKQELFGKIAALKTLNTSMPKIKLTNSIVSINNKNDTIEFLYDLLISLMGYQDMIKIFVDILTNVIQNLQTELKTSLKNEIKTLVSCEINPTLPETLKNNGVDLSLKNIDFFDILKVSDATSIGGLLYSNNDNDLDKVFSKLIQNKNSSVEWNNILKISLDSINQITKNTSINVKPINSNNLNDFNNKYIDSIEILDLNVLINKTLDDVLGLITSELSNTIKTEEQLSVEEQINTLIDKINVNEYEIDDSFFVFDNQELYDIHEKVTKRKNGLYTYVTNDVEEVQVNNTVLIDLTNEMNNSVEIEDKKTILYQYLTKVCDDVTATTDNDNKDTVKYGFLKRLIQILTRNIITSLMQPKIVTLFSINHQLLYGNQNYNDGLDFIKINKSLLKNIIKIISNEVISQILTILVKELNSLVSESVIKKKYEKIKNKKIQVLSLLGIPSDTIRLIKSLT